MHAQSTKAKQRASALAYWSTINKQERHLRGQAISRGRGNGRGRKRPFGTADCHVEELPRATRSAWIYDTYGLTPEDEARLYERQRGMCGLCGVPLPTSWLIDHDHLTSIVRGLLCSRWCNSRAIPVLEQLGVAGCAYTEITPVDLYLRAHAGA